MKIRTLSFTVAVLGFGVGSFACSTDKANGGQLEDGGPSEDVLGKCRGPGCDAGGSTTDGTVDNGGKVDSGGRVDSGGTAGRCTNPVFTSSDPHEDHAFPNGYTVFNNVWSGSGGPQTIYACSPSSWYVVSNQPVLSNSRGEIKSYPCTQWMFNGKALNTFTAISSTFAHTAPASGVWDAAYDIWLGPGGWDIEVMLWTDYRYLGTLPPGGNETDHPTIDGQPYIAWAEPDHKYIALAMAPMKTSGTVNFRHVFDWLVSKGWLPANAPLNAFEYGVEIAETNGPATFSVNDFSVTSR